MLFIQGSTSGHLFYFRVASENYGESMDRQHKQQNGLLQAMKASKEKLTLYVNKMCFLELFEYYTELQFATRKLLLVSRLVISEI